MLKGSCVEKIRERYSTASKNGERIGVSSKMSNNSRSLIGKKQDIKRITFSNMSDDLIFRENNAPFKTMTSSEVKKKNFIINRRKITKAMSAYLRESDIIASSRSQWIGQVEYQTYQGLREYNEDRILIKEDVEINEKEFGVFAVFDGHGGSSASEYLKTNFIKVFQSFAKNMEIQEALRRTFEDLQMKILQCGTKIGSGSCATVLVVNQNNYWTANIGDSRILNIKDKQILNQITQDHKPQCLREKLRIEKLGGKIYRNSLTNELTGEKTYGPFRVLPSKLSVSRTVGDFMIKKNQSEKFISAEADITSGKLEHGSVVVLMSDGAYEQFSNIELSLIFANSGKESLKQRLTNFMSASKKRGTNDNVSVIAIQIKSKGKSTQNTEASETSISPENSLKKIQIKL